MMKPGNRWLALTVAVLGLGLCLSGLFGFVSSISNNELSWTHGPQTARDHYLAVGQSYSQGFTVGFFLCLCLVAAAAAVRSILDQGREGSRPCEALRFEEPSPEPPRAEDPHRPVRRPAHKTA